MNILLWILQIALGLHTAMGAFWKLSHSEKTVYSLDVIPHAVWTGLSVIEFFCVLGLILPLFSKKAAIAAPVAATIIALEMLVFCIIHISSGETDMGPVYYWFVVAIISAFVAYGRFAIKPL